MILRPILGLICALLVAAPGAATAGATATDSLRIATFSPEMTRHGPGLLLRDILRGKDPQVAAVVAVIVREHPDVLLLTGMDYDAGLAALSALRDRLAAAGAPYPHLFALRPNTGVPSGVDLDGDGRSWGPRDAQGYGHFAGHGGMALLSRVPIDTAASRDFSAFLWHDLPGSLIDGAKPSVAARAAQRLPTTGHWDVVLHPPGHPPLHLLAFFASPPVFDGPEDRNGRRNHDEIVFWRALLDRRLTFSPPSGPFVILGDANLDPADGDGRHDAICSLLADRRLKDPAPRSNGASAAADAGRTGNPAFDTVDWPEAGGPGNLRVDYVLPSAGLRIAGSGVDWPAPGTPGAKEATAASRHRLVWVDITLP